MVHVGFNTTMARQFSSHRLAPTTWRVGVALAVGVVMTGLWTIVLRDAPEIDEFPTTAFGNIASLLVLSMCVALGILFRHKSATHQRLMLFA